MRDRERKLIDVGSTTALNAMVEILESRTTGVLARQARAMLARLEKPDHVRAIEGFCDELQTFIESVPGIRHPSEPEKYSRSKAR